MKNIFLLGGFLALSFGAFSQPISGTVFEKGSTNPIPGVNIYWQGTTQGTISGSDGKFRLDAYPDLPNTLVFSFVGFKNDTLLLGNAKQNIQVYLNSSLEMDEIQITEKRNAFEMSAADKLNTETINRGVLRKAACCNLSESFEASASVDVVLNDAVTGTRKIQMLGLEGIYVQKLFEGIPYNRGLGNVLGFDQIPGTWINSIQLTKGVGTVVNGYESLTGVINLNFLPPDGPESLYLDLYGNSQERFEANGIWNKIISPKWSTAVLVNGNSQQQKIDRNGDGFLDMPLRKGVKLMNRWKYRGDNVRSQIMAGYTNENRTSGQSQFNYNEDFGNTQAYGFGLGYEQFEVMGKLGIPFKKRDDQSVGIRAAANHTETTAYFGNTPYSGVETSANINAIFMSKFSKYSDHSLTTGIQYLYDDYEESYSDSAFGRTESAPGLFVEYTYIRPRFTSVAGARIDFHNLYGTQFSPRLHAKYNLKPLTAVRAAIGRGFRAPNAFADQLGILASSRIVRVLDNPIAESSWNSGISLLHKFPLLGLDAVFNIDYYYTFFENQLVVDRDNSTSTLLFYNLNGNSTAHSFQTDIQAELVKGLAAKVSYKFQEVRVDYISGNKSKPFVPKHRAMFNIGYTSQSSNWYLDFTANWYGSQRIPDTSLNPEGLRLADRSEHYFLFNAQVTRVFGPLEVYAGGENLGNFIQSNAIIDPDNPFGSNFDSTLIYGPLNGRTFYLGVRLNLKTNKS